MNSIKSVLCFLIPHHAKKKPTWRSKVRWLAKSVWYDVTWKSSMVTKSFTNAERVELAGYEKVYNQIQHFASSMDGNSLCVKLLSMFYVWWLQHKNITYAKYFEICNWFNHHTLHRQSVFNVIFKDNESVFLLSEERSIKLSLFSHANNQLPNKMFYSGMILLFKAIQKTLIFRCCYNVRRQMSLIKSLNFVQRLGMIICYRRKIPEQ